MPALNIKPSHKSIKNYYVELEKYEYLGEQNEGTVRAAFQSLLQHYCGQSDLTLLCEKAHYTAEKKRVTPDGEIVDTFGLPHGHWEAKDTKDDLHAEAAKKLAAGYPSKNIVVQSPTHALLYQRGQLHLDLDITDPTNLVRVLRTFFGYQEENISAWHTAVAEFKETVPQLGEQLAALIETERQNNTQFQEAFTRFHQQCQVSINPNLSIAAVGEMLIQHLLTERIFRTVFNNRDFTRRNIIAREIENVIDALISQTFDRNQFLESLDPFYVAIEQTASTITDFSQKQGFLNTVYEQFFQGFSVKVADTHGIVYTPQPIVDFMVKSVEHILQTEFNRSLADTGVNIIDPFVGTGNFIVRIMQELDPISLARKFATDPPELQCNEVMLLPYYIASLNIEHQFYTATNQYVPYQGLCLVDTFGIAEERQMQLFTPANTVRVEKQKETPMFVVIGNPPYNAGQVNENDNNKNRPYPVMDARVRETYSQDSKATNKNALSDTYVKAIRWASDRIGEEGGDSQCFPFYTYNEDGTNRRENITDWALAEFQTHYWDDTITKWDIFHYTYGLLHHPTYREKYQVNLKRDLPHIPFAKDFWGFANAGARLAELHVNYESQPEYGSLKFIQNSDVTLNWRVEKMKLSKDKTSLVYNDFLTIDGIPPKTFDYRLGTRSALEWVVDQYRIKTDKRSGIVNNPNRAHDPEYIVKLIGKVITVSLETVKIVSGLPALTKS